MADPAPIILSAERLLTWELCKRRYIWQDRYANLRVSLLRALYIALDAGLRSQDDPEKAAESQLLSLARSPGLDIVGEDVYAVAVHTAKLAGILSLALRSAWNDPWRPVDPVSLPKGRTWHSGLYDAGEGHLRRIALIDRWSDDRRMQETWGWRTLGEVCAVNQTILITAITIGPAHDRRWHSPWTKAFQAPRGNVFRFKRRAGQEGFSNSWNPIWRESTDIPIEQWLTKMREDGCMTDLVHTVQVPVPRNRDAYMAQMLRMSREMEKLAGEPTPPMRLAGCFGFSPCNFRCTCHDGINLPDPGTHGFKLREELVEITSAVTS